MSHCVVLDIFAQGMYRVILRKSSSKMELTKRFQHIQINGRFKEKAKVLNSNIIHK